MGLCTSLYLLLALTERLLANAVDREKKEWALLPCSPMDTASIVNSGNISFKCCRQRDLKANAVDREKKEWAWVSMNNQETHHSNPVDRWERPASQCCQQKIKSENLCLTAMHLWIHICLGGSKWAEIVPYEQGVPLRRSGHPTCLYSYQNKIQPTMGPQNWRNRGSIWLSNLFSAFWWRNNSNKLPSFLELGCIWIVSYSAKPLRWWWQI